MCGTTGARQPEHPAARSPVSPGDDAACRCAKGWAAPRERGTRIQRVPYLPCGIRRTAIRRGSDRSHRSPGGLCTDAHARSGAGGRAGGGGRAEYGCHRGGGCGVLAIRRKSSNTSPKAWRQWRGSTLVAATRDDVLSTEYVGRGAGRSDAWVATGTTTVSDPTCATISLAKSYQVHSPELHA